MISRGCIEIIKGTEFEELLFPKPMSLSDRIFLKNFRAEADREADWDFEGDEHPTAPLQFQVNPQSRIKRLTEIAKNSDAYGLSSEQLEIVKSEILLERGEISFDPDNGPGAA